jgi:hypothetical protein
MVNVYTILDKNFLFIILAAKVWDAKVFGRPALEAMRKLLWQSLS